MRSELVVFWDADDVMPPGTLAAMAGRMGADRRLGLVATRIAEGEGRAHHWPRPFTSRLARRSLMFALVNSVSSLVPTVGAMMRTSTVRDAGGFPDLETGDDWVLGVAMTVRGRVDVVEHLGRIYHQHSDSVWANSQTTTHLLEHAAAVRALIMRDPGVPRSVKLALPAIALGQWLVIGVLRPLSRLARG